MASTEQVLANDIERLGRVLKEHIGAKPSVSSTYIPHTQLCAITRGAYVVTNAVDRRTFDPTTVSLQHLAEVVSTIISDLQAIKVLG